ncbi:MAG TPA: alpha/beta hydrolase-fold protein [Rhodothermales bacterium]|nr:alpha/beta hydrolase-fold protein [Rhodothermales bacterium]
MHRAILARHARSLHGHLWLWRFPSRALGLRKPLFVYEPPGFESGAAYPTVWLFRGHEREWVNQQEDGSRARSTAVEDVDAAIQARRLPPVVLVMPGLTSSNNHVHGVGIDMAAPGLNPQPGLGTGRFWTYLTDELIPAVDRRYRASQRLAAGFSLGGFTVSLLAFGKPGWLDHAGFYDALFTWPRHDDPRLTPRALHTDRVFTGASILSPAFGWPRDRAALDRWNPTDWLIDSRPAGREPLRRTTYWIRCAAADGSRGNRDRALALQRLLRRRGLPLGYDSVVLHPEAAHTWHWCDRFLMDFLRDTLAQAPTRTPDDRIGKLSTPSPEPRTADQ